MLLKLIVEHFQVRDVDYDPEKQQFVFTTRRAFLIFGIIWSLIVLIIALALVRYARFHTLLQGGYFILTRSRMVREVGFEATAQGIVIILPFIELVLSLRQVYHMLIKVTIIGERGVIRRNSRLFNSSQMLSKINFNNTGSCLRIRKGKTLWLTVSNKTEYFEELLEVLINREIDTDE